MFDSFYPYNPGTWCNGNTTVFGAVILGSNPSIPTKVFPSVLDIGMGGQRVNLIFGIFVLFLKPGSFTLHSKNSKELNRKTDKSRNTLPTLRTVRLLGNSNKRWGL